MIDLHCHLLPGIDDGAEDMDTALRMARIAHEDGIRLTACTPHIYPGVYENTAQGIRAGIAELEQRLREAELPLQLTIGADTHLVPEVIAGLRSGRIPTLGGGRYFLLEPPHHAAPPRFEDSVFQVMANGYIPLITHPERLGWVGDHYQAFVALAHRGAWMQLTAGSLTGRFGPEARYWSERMLDEGLVHVLATDAHGVKHRSPLLAEGCRAAEKWVGAEEAERMVRERPQAVIENRDPASVPNPPGLSDDTAPRPLRRSKPAWLARLFG